jgi:hypothetical protein
VLLCSGVFAWNTCLPMAASYGVLTDRCPTGSPVLELHMDAWNLARGETGQVRLSPEASWVAGDDWRRSFRTKELSWGAGITLELRDTTGEPISPLTLDWEEGWLAEVDVPDVPDGDYLLRATADTWFGTASVDAELPLYTSALLHVLPDRPLVRPGDEVHLRAVALAATDKRPLADRPGTWRIVSPTGEVVWEEVGRTSEWGVSSTSFPLDARAPRGTWTFSWSSGGDVASTEVVVKPFELPSLEVGVSADQAWYGPGPEVVLSGTATFASGAPLANSEVAVSLAKTEGAWPLPIPWTELAPVRTDASGRFELSLGPVPADLRDRVEIRVVAEVTEEGETVTGSGRLVLSADALRVEAETELGDGLVGGFNNRVWLRVTTPDGRPVVDETIEVTPAWDTAREPWTATTDADGVAALQVDPGDPVTVVLPPMPVRRRAFVPPKPELLALVGLGGNASLADRRALDLRVDAVDRCSVWVEGPTVEQTKVAMNVGADGRVRVVQDDGTGLGRCVAEALAPARLPRGVMRTLSVEWRLHDPKTATLAVSADLSASVAGVAELTDLLEGEGRRCIARTRRSERLGSVHVRARAGSARLEVLGIDLLGRGRTCLASLVRSLELDTPSSEDALGAFTFRATPGLRDTVPEPIARTHVGYELAVSRGAEVGRVLLPEGTVPDLRVRLQPPLPQPGDTVVATFLRGPGYRRDLEGDVQLKQGSSVWDEVEIDEASRTATFVIPEDARGFAEVRFWPARSLVYVADPTPLEVRLGTSADVYRPGATAQLTVETATGGTPSPASVTLVGVDAMLGQLATLPGPDALGESVVRVGEDRPAFGVFSGAMLALGQVRGDHAATAALLRIGDLPDDAGGEKRMDTHARGDSERGVLQAEAFHRVLTRLYGDVAAWESSAPEGEIMTNARLAEMYDAALDAVRDSGRPVVDSYGVEVTLGVLPPELLTLADPRELVGDATRLPEDVVDWQVYVHEEVVR